MSDGVKLKEIVTASNIKTSHRHSCKLATSQRYFEKDSKLFLSKYLEESVRISVSTLKQSLSAEHLIQCRNVWWSLDYKIINGCENCENKELFVALNLSFADLTGFFTSCFAYKLCNQGTFCFS